MLRTPSQTDAQDPTAKWKKQSEKYESKHDEEAAHNNDTDRNNNNNNK